MARPRKLVRRQPNGQPYRAPERVSAETVFVRQRELVKDGINPDEWQNSLAGFTLGRLRLRGQADAGDPGGISDAQFQAGEAWARIVHRHGQIMGYEVRRNVKSPGFEMVGGASLAPDASDEEVGRVRDRFKCCYDALMAVCRDHGMRVATVTWGVCLENWPAADLSHADHGALRLGLNALAKILK